uniref:RNA-binding protein RO60 vWA domain-containing protein n=1 Tax=Timema tahoe TaxID=61484 RepID=A0A7R9IIW3_9NEOP|nr:unnamed protein product [Timema tahoe]
MTSLVLIDSSQLTADGFEKLPDQIMFVTCALSCSQIVVANPSDPLMLDIAGYDGHVPRIIEAFSRGAF